MDYLERRAPNYTLIEESVDLGNLLARRFQFNNRKRPQINISRRTPTEFFERTGKEINMFDLSNSILEEADERRAYDPYADIIQLNFDI